MPPTIIRPFVESVLRRHPAVISAASAATGLLRRMSIKPYHPSVRRREAAVRDTSTSPHAVRCHLFREKGNGATPTIIIAGFVPDATEVTEFQRGLLRNYGSIYYLNYSHNGFSPEMFSAQLGDLIEDINRRGEQPILFSISFGSGLLARFLRERQSIEESRIRGVVMVSPVFCTEDLVRPDGARKGGVRILESNLRFLLLKRCSALGGKELPELLPHLELIIHGGAGMKPYRGEFDRLFGSRQPGFLELLPSSEAFMAFQLPGEELMRFTPYYGAFFEFVPFEDLDARGTPHPDAATVPLEGIEIDRRYAVILSTCAGLWRYHIGDTLRFTSRNPLHMEFTGRDRFLDRFEEKVTQGEVEEAVAALNRVPGVQVREFMVGADIPGRRHLWVLAVRHVSSVDRERFADLLDSVLLSLNADYAAFRCQGRINRPGVVILEEGMIYAWSKELRGKLGGQSKIPHIDPTPDGEMVHAIVTYAAR